MTPAARRWYLPAIFCGAFSFFTFAAGPRLGYPEHVAHEIAVLIAVWTPVLVMFGVRSELVNRKGS